MFKISSFEQELVKEMQSRLVANQAENEYSFNKLAKAADYLNTAAELFDDVGMTTQAESVTRILEKIAEDEDIETITPSPDQISIVEKSKAVEVIKKLLDANLNLEDLKKVEIVLHEEIEAKGGTPKGMELETEITAPLTVGESDFSDLRTSKKKV